MPENKPRDYLVGVDLGGTKILAGVFTLKLELIGQAKISTKAHRGVETVIERIAHCIHEVVDECDLSLKQIKAVGVGAPGTVDAKLGKVIFAPNLPGWKEVPLQKELEKALDLPVVVGNDCNLCTLGVHEVELKGKPRHMVGMFVGTGIGGGLILNGELYLGHNLTAGEVGHMVVAADGPKCGCGNRGCLEAVASRTALFRKVQAAIKAGQKTVLTDLLGNDLNDMRSGDLRKAIRRGDKVVERIVLEAAAFLGVGVASLINIVNPEVFVLGGGVIEALEGEMMPTIIKTAQQHVMAGTLKGAEIRASHLGDNAGITGAAVIARSRSK